MDQAKLDLVKITGNAATGFGKSVTFTTPDNSTTVTINAINSTIGLEVDDFGRPVVGAKSHVSVAEKLLTDEGYPVRNAAGHVVMEDHRITVADSTDTPRTFLVESGMPDSTIGLITLMLTNYDPA